MIIYITENLINGKKYIGQSIHNDPKYLGSGKYFKRSVKKYGRKNFKKTILEFCTTTDELNGREIYWISYYDAANSKDYYNIHLGGNSGKMNAEANERRRESLQGQIFTDERKRNISIAKTGLKDSEETKKRKSESAKKVDHYWLSSIYKEGGKNPRAIKVVQYDALTNNFIKEWDCMRDIDRYYVYVINSTRKLMLKNKPRDGFIFKMSAIIELNTNEIVVEQDIVDINTIMYISKNKDSTIIHLANNIELKSWMSLNYYMGILEKYNIFFRTHNSYIVNITKVVNNIKLRNYNILTMCNREQLRLSKGKRNEYYACTTIGGSNLT